MTTAEQKSIENLNRTLYEIRESNNQFRKDVMEMVDKLNSKTEAKHLPVQLETNILQVTQVSINNAISEVLTKYDSPLIKLVKVVIESHTAELKDIIDTSFTSVIRQDEFKESIVKAFSHKVAKTIISNNDGLFDKVANELKQDSVFKAKMAIAVSNVVEECLRENK